MKLIFRGHDDRYAVEQSLLAFFPEERPVYKPAEEGEDRAAPPASTPPAPPSPTTAGRPVASPGPPWTRN